MFGSKELKGRMSLLEGVVLVDGDEGKVVRERNEVDRWVKIVDWFEVVVVRVGMRNRRRREVKDWNWRKKMMRSE